MSQVNQTRFLVQRDSYQCKWALNQTACNSKQKQKHNECQFLREEIDDQSFYYNDYVWNPTTCDFECNQPC